MKHGKTLLLALVLALGLCACGNAEEISPQDEAETTLDQLLDTIEEGLAEEYDGQTLSHDTSTITVSVWKDSMTDTANEVLADEDGPQDERWSRVRSEAETSVIFVADCIRTSDFSSMQLLFNVLDESDKSRVLLTFTNSGVAYDLVQDTASKTPEEPEEETPAEEETEQPAETSSEQSDTTQTEQNSTSSTGSQTSSGTSGNNAGSSGNANNFNTYDNPEQQQTSASYVLNTSTKKFHKPTCRDVPRISPENYDTSSAGRDSIVSQGYSPCGHCNP